MAVAKWREYKVNCLQKPGQKISDNRLVLSNISNSSCSHNGNVECGRYDLKNDLRRLVRVYNSCFNSYLSLSTSWCTVVSANVKLAKSAESPP